MENIIKIFAQVYNEQILIDKRLRRRSAIFGSVENVAKQYGIKCKKHKNGLIFSAPKTRMQIFVEKLHFSEINYIEI
jgi:hypothetical protein